MRIVLLIAALSAPTGQVAKFDGRQPEANYVTPAKLEDVERCLIRVGSPPQVYRQPDRPNEVSLVWSAGGVSSGNAAARVDLRRVDNGTDVKAWLDRRLVLVCGPS